ncbi:hypothetical protein [Bradyrhizobium huanghuaihaiense]|uniref:hypothetical protein n=1 Tax=Bradyrhizobium huanghuaihaiense TaxID=990078 RepID=UPI003CC60839
MVPHLADALAFARWLTRDRADAEDVVQEALALRPRKKKQRPHASPTKQHSGR